MAIECWLSFNNREEVLQLPVTPFFNIESTQLNQTVTLNHKGEVNLPGLRGLKTLTLESFFPHKGHNYNFLLYKDTLNPYQCCQMIQKWKESRRPIRVILTNTDINLAMLIESFSYGQKDGTRDIYYSLSLKEYIFFNAKRLNSKGANSISPNSKLKTWTVKKGDTLTKIALAKWGDSKKYTEIIRLNKGKIKNIHSLKNIAGEVLYLE